MRMIDPQNTAAVRGTRHANGAARVSRRATIRAAFAGLVAGWAIQTPRRVGADEAAPSDSAPEMVDIGGRSIALECRGSGGPTVVLVSGYRDTSLVWTIDFADSTPPRTMVMPAVATDTRVCAYDRPGTVSSIGENDLVGRSDTVPQPRTLPDVVEELHALVQAAGIETPFVLAAHSLGGAVARLYASTWPEDVAGMVLIDAYSEFIEALLTPDQWQSLVAFNAGLGTDTVVPIPGYGDLETIPYGSANAALWEATARTSLPPMPLAVLAHGLPFEIDEPPTGFTASTLDDSLTQANRRLATLVPDARYFTGAESGHYIQQDQPELVTEAIRQVVAGVREPDTWYSLQSCCAD